MSWVRIDDHFPDHPKIAALGVLGPVAGWLHVAALCYCARYLTDGFIPDGQVTRLAELGPRAKPTDVAARLVDVGLWDRTQGGYVVHDYLEYNPSRVDVLDARAKRQASGRAGGQASAQARGQASATPDVAPLVPTRLKQNATPVPSPVPVPSSESLLGLPHIDAEAQAFLEGMTGRAVSAAGGRNLTEYDRQIEDHGFDAVVSAYRRAAKTLGPKPMARQLVWTAMKILEPFGNVKDVEREDRADEERAALGRRLSRTQELIRGYRPDTESA